ncbi:MULTISPECIES: WhiB family transcriptional regulator [Actinomycetes]|uniref:WhiB family transcriptional regulator n=1 Tax=Actinomycetes TaxID=1760 RepID=UPI003404846C
MNWRLHGSCRSVDPELFFPVGYSIAADRQAAEAIAICHTCPVIDTCRTWATTTREPHGIWGGLTEDDRTRARRGLGPRREKARCGTRAGYRRHLINSETPCGGCRRANTAAAQRSARRKAQRQAANAA